MGLVTTTRVTQLTFSFLLLSLLRVTPVYREERRRRRGKVTKTMGEKTKKEEKKKKTQQTTLHTFPSL